MTLTLVCAAIEGIGAFGAFHNGEQQCGLVPRVDLADYLASPAQRTPVLIRDIVPPDAIESLADELMTTLGHEEVRVQRKVRDAEDGYEETTMYDTSLRDSIDCMMASRRGDAWFAFCEGLLPSSAPGSAELSNKLQAIREAPFSEQENWFDYFPAEMAPTDAVVLAGAGATSTLHRDPFEWTGTSVCLEGTKIWRFVLPPPEAKGGVAVVDEALDSYRLDSVAWEGEEPDAADRLVLSAGWQSDMTLYDAVGERLPSAREWMRMEEEDIHNFERQMRDLGTDASLLRPCEKSAKALERVREAAGPSDGTRPSFVAAVQQPGDLLLIPAHCWHQTYAPVPSIAVASQRCGARTDGGNVVRHIVETARSDNHGELPEMLTRGRYEEGNGAEVVANLVEHLTRAKSLVK